MTSTKDDAEVQTFVQRNSWAELGRAASDLLQNKPPLETSLGFLRRCSVLATLCNYVYSYKETDVGSKSAIPLDLEGVQTDIEIVGATLLHFREAVDNGEVSGPQQFGIWSVTRSNEASSDDFIAVVFRGTSSLDDVVVDANITPQPLSSGSSSPIALHAGFHSGATEHVDDIVKVLQKADSKAGRTLPVWLAGHSLGGGYANALVLHLLNSKRTNELFRRGGGSITFGAPYVVHSADREQVYKQLAALEGSVQLQEGSDLSFHNFVNNADPVPRLLGGSLDAVHGLLATKVPMIKHVRQLAKQYHPFGHYHLIIGKEVRSISMPEATAGISVRLGNAEYAARVNEQLDLNYMWRMVYGTTGKGSGWTHHNMTSYQERLASHIEALLKNSSIWVTERQAPIFSPADKHGQAEWAKSTAASQMSGAVQAGAVQAVSSAYAWWTAKPSSSKPREECNDTRLGNRAEQGESASWKWFQQSRWKQNS